MLGQGRKADQGKKELATEQLVREPEKCQIRTLKPKGCGTLTSLPRLISGPPARFIETLNRLGIIHRRTAYNHPEGNSYIERFHRSLKEEEVWTAEYRNVQEARASIARWIQEYNHDRPHRGVGNRTPHEVFLSFATVLKNHALTV